MSPLRFKKEVEFSKGRTYSVCLRGARRYDVSDEFHLSLYTPEHWEKPKEIANIVSQNNYRFADLMPKDYADNYDVSIKSIDDLKDAMSEIYNDFEEREIVTILRFEVA